MEDLRILDLSWLLPGPFATMLFADLGADVVKIERPGDGDYARRNLPELFAVVNRNKRSVVLDLKRPEGQQVLHRLVATADVLVEGFRPGVTARLNADYATLSAINPGLVYCSISGYGQDSPYQDVPGHDLSYMGVGGGITAPPDLGYPPVRGSLPVADLSSAMFAAFSILTALRERERSGRGQHLDVSMTDCVASWASVRIAPMLWNREPPVYNLWATNRVYEAGDGKRLSLSVTEDDFFRKLCVALGRDDWLHDERLATRRGRLEHAMEMLPELEEIFARRPRDEWLTLLREHDVPCGPVNDAEDVMTDPHIRTRGLLWERTDNDGIGRTVVGFPVQMSARRPEWRRMPPELGEHTDDVLSAAGYDAGEIASLRRLGVLGQSA